LMAEARGDAPLHAAPQGTREQFHFKSDRPGLGIIDLRQSTAQIRNFVRALDFGADDNWMCRAKLSLPGGLFLVEQVDVVPGAGDPGKVLAFDRDAISIAVADGVLRFSSLATPDGDPVTAAMTGVRVGQVLAMTDLSVEASNLDAAFTKHERFWVDRLARSRAPMIPDLRAATGRPDAALELRTLP